MARPTKEIDFVELDKLCMIQCTAKEIAWFFGVSEDTLGRRIQEEYGESFADYFKRASSEGKMSLRRKQYEIANKGNVTMLIWLGKQHLGQVDKMETSGETTHKIKVDEGNWDLKDPNEEK